MVWCAGGCGVAPGWRGGLLVVRWVSSPFRYREPAVSLLQVSECMSCPSELVLLLPCLKPVVVERVEVRGDLVLVRARAAAGGASCRGCGTWCTRRHGGYVRTLRDSGIGGRRVLIRLLVRVLACGNADCPVVTFAEQPEIGRAHV